MGLSKFELVPGDINLASDWVLLDDIGNRRMQIPEFITHVVTLQRPDIFLYSKSAKRTIIIELTCPNEDGFEISKEIKEKRYEDLQKTIIANNFDCNVFTIEVGVRGNIRSDQVNIWTKHIGTPIKAMLCEVTRISRQCSYVLFQTRNMAT